MSANRADQDPEEDPDRDPEEDPELDILAAFGVLRRIEAKLPQGYSLLGDDEAIVIEALSQHSSHFQAHRSIIQRSLDPFKLICWVAGTLLEGVERDEEGSRHQGETIIRAAIRVLQEALLLETDVLLTCEDERLIEAFVLEEFFGDSSHGVGRNGLYLAFHCARSAIRVQRS